MITVEHPARRHNGLFLNLSDDDYHQSLGLSSHGVSNLRVSPMHYWVYAQALNPDYLSLRSAEETQAMIVGRAYETFILGGREEFSRWFYGGLDRLDYPEAVKTNKEIINRIIERGGPQKGYSGKKKETLIKMLTDPVHPWAEPDALIWEVLEKGHAAANQGKIMLPTETVRQIEIAAAMINLDPDLAPLIQGGVAKPCVFWEEPNGVPCKAQFDYWTPSSITDIKTYNDRGRDLDRAIRAAFKAYRYDWQEAFYHRAWRYARRFIQNGMVYGEFDDGLLDRMAMANDITVTFIFQCKGFAPVAKGKALPAISQIRSEATRDIEETIQKWSKCWEMFGEERWIPTYGVETWSDEDFAYL